MIKILIIGYFLGCLVCRTFNYLKATLKQIKIIILLIGYWIDNLWCRLFNYLITVLKYIKINIYLIGIEFNYLETYPKYILKII